MALINFPILYIPNPDKFGTLAFGKIFVGIPDLDPEDGNGNPINSKQLRVVQEDGTKVNVPQPFILSAGGEPQYNGSTVRLDVNGNHSLKILTSNNVQKHYIHNVETLHGDLSLTIDFPTKLAYEEFAGELPVDKRVYLADRDAYFNVIAGTVGANTFDIIASTSVNQSISITESQPKPVQFGAIPEINDAPTITQNNGSLQAYADYCMTNKLVQDYRNNTFYYDSTLDLTTTSTRNAFIQGDCDNSNNVGKFNLVYLGAGNAILGKAITHWNLGVAGTENVIDTIPLTSVGIEASESVKHWGSCIRNFDKGYVIKGGFYHSFIQGRVSRCRDLYDFTQATGGIFNTRFDLQNSDFVNGIVANGGDGPINIAGSWESWTGFVLTKTTGDPAYNVVLDGPYFENGPTSTVAAGLTGNDLDTYIANGALLLSNSSISGAATVVVNNGLSLYFLNSSLGIPCLDLNISLYGGVTLPSLSIIRAPSIDNMDLKIDFTNANFTSLPVLSGGSELNEFTNGTHSNTSGGVTVLDGDDWNVLTLINSWTNDGATTKDLSYKVINDILYIQGYMDGASATSQVIAIIPSALLSRIPDAQFFFNVSHGGGIIQGRLIMASGDLRIESTGFNECIIDIALPLK